MAGFDEVLNETLSERAVKAGRSAEQYVAEAVAMRLLADVELGSTQHSDLLAKFEETGIDIPKEAKGPHSVITDPDRLRAVYATGLMDARPDPAVDRIADMAAEALLVPRAAISLLARHRQFFVSISGGSAGDDVRETPMERSICQYAVASGRPLVVADARVHPVLKYSPTVTDGTVVSYLGVPLVDAAGFAVGTLCVWDQQPRRWTTGHVDTLRDLAQLVAGRIFRS